MARNAHGGNPRARKPSDDGPEFRIHDMRRAYKRPHHEEWTHGFEDEEVEELEDFDELSDFEDRELGVLDESAEPEEEEQE